MLDQRAFTQLKSVPPGPDLAALLAAAGRHADPDAACAFRSIDLDALDPIDKLAAWQRVQSWVDAELNDTILAVAGNLHHPDDDDWGREEVAAALCWSNGYTGERIELARVLGQRLWQTRDALRAGRVTLRHAADIAKALEPLGDEDLINRAERAILAKAPGRTVAQLARIARREAMKHDPRGADERHKAARKQRRIEFTPMPDGMAELRAYLPADAATRLRTAIDQLAGRTRAKGDDRSIDQRRADALVVLAEYVAIGASGQSGPGGSQPAQGEPAGSGRAPHGPTPSGPSGRSGSSARQAAPPRVALIAPLATVTGAAELPGELVAYGPVPPVVVRGLAGAEGARWEKWIADPGGVITDLGSTTYRPPAALAALVRAGHPTCVFPGCGQPSYRCDLDHVVRWADGGLTNKANLVPICRRHHRAKDEAGWHLHRAPDGTCHWTSPASHEYTVEPHHYDIDSGPDGVEDTCPASDASTVSDAGPDAELGADHGEDWSRPLAAAHAIGRPIGDEEEPPPF